MTRIVFEDGKLVLKSFSYFGRNPAEAQAELQRTLDDIQRRNSQLELEQKFTKSDRLTGTEIEDLRQNKKEADTYAQKKFPRARMAEMDRLTDAEIEDLRRNQNESLKCIQDKYFPCLRLTD
jgi:DNA-binding transcriptional regulator YiaG